MTDTSSDSEPPLVPPTERRVLSRALILAAVTCRADIETNRTQVWAQELQPQVNEWLDQEDLLGEAEESERTLLLAPVGSLASQEQVNGTWRSEGLGVLAWALCKADLAPPDRCHPSSDIAGAIGFLKPDVSDLLEQASLRDRRELERYRELAFTLHWRLKHYGLERDRMDFLTFAKEYWFGPLETGGLKFVDRELSIGGVRLDQADDEVWPGWRSIAQERQVAANWLAGYDAQYSDVTADT